MTQPFDPTRFHDFERAGWQRAADRYGDAFGGLTSQTADRLLDAVHATRGTRLLDVATGPGFIAGAAAARGAVVAGVDFSAAMIARARARHPSIDFREGDAEALPFDAAAFDAVVMNFGMLHLARPEQAVAEAHRVLRRGGWFAFTVWGAPEQALGFGLVMRAVEQHGTTDVGLPEGPPFFQFSEAATCRRTLHAAGFAEVEVAPLPLVWELTTPDAAFVAVSQGGVRTAAVLRAQSPEALEQIRAAVRHGVESFRSADGTFSLPMLVVLASGKKTQP
jgi:ubiquinone/menaquinone biosynthesis C-methylase UbiE